MKNSFVKTNFYFSISIIVIFLIILLNTLVKEGMFMDGLIYSTISRNLSIGIGSLWYPKFSETIFPIFNEHPPLVFGIQSLFFKLFGTSIYIERFYTLFTAIVTLFLIKYLWKTLFRDLQIRFMWWLPVLFWIITPVVFWSYSNNMLECTMGIFTLLGVIFSVKYVLSNSKYRYIYLLLVSISVILGLLSKGFPALFPIAVIPIYWIVYKKPKFLNVILSSLIIVFLIAGIMYLLLLNTDIYNNLSAYFNSQVVESIAGERNAGNRLFIVFRLLRELLPMVLISTFIVLLAIIIKAKFTLENENKKIVIFSLLVGLSASLPVVISPKQMGFYILPSYPFFAIAFATLAAPILQIWINKISKIFIMKIASAILILFLAFIIFFNIGKYSRDKNIIEDIKIMSSIVPSKSLVATEQYFYNKWSFVSYLYRYNLNSIDKSGEKNTFLIARKKTKIDDDKYAKVNKDFNEIDLYKKIENDK